MLDVGRLVAETLMYMEREERSGPDYHPTSSGLQQMGSTWAIYVGDQELQASVSGASDCGARRVRSG